MDEIKLTANQRFDLLDMTRLKSYIQTGFAELMRQVMGEPYHYSGVATWDRTDAPLVFRDFSVSHGGAPSLVFTVSRVWTGLYSKTYEGTMFDKDGYRIGGPNSATSKQLTVAAAPGSTTRYLMIRRALTDDTPEPRKFYSSSTGKYTTTVNTRTIEDWEIQENANSASTTAALRDAGWIDLVSFQTNGTDDITAQTTINSDIMFRDILTWALGATLPDQGFYGGYSSIPTMISGLRQMLSLLRGDSDWSDDPANHAEFHSEGGLRFGSGDTSDSGKYNLYLSALSPNVVAVSDEDMPTALTDMEILNAKGIVTEGPPSPAANKGYIYTDTFGTFTPLILEREFDVPADFFRPEEMGANTIWTSTGVHKCWRRYNSTPPGWVLTWNGNGGGADTSYYLLGAVHLLDGVRIYQMEVFYNVLSTSSSITVEHALRRYNKSTGATSAVGSNSSVVGTSTGWTQKTTFTSGSIAVDNEAYGYYVQIYLSDPVGVDEGDIIRFHGATIHGQIREASYIF